MAIMAEPRYRAGELVDFAAALFAAAGCDGDKPRAIAAGLVEADLLGHTTHGLQLAPAYLRELESGSMTARGQPEVVADRGGAVTWDGRRLPGIWLTAKAIALAIERVAQHGIVAVVIRRSHHIGCLASFLQRATERGLMILIASSDPAVASVRAVWWPPSRSHPRSDRNRHPDRRRSNPDRHQRVDHDQWHVGPPSP